MIINSLIVGIYAWELLKYSSNALYKCKIYIFLNHKLISFLSFRFVGGAIEPWKGKGGRLATTKMKQAYYQSITPRRKAHTCHVCGVSIAVMGKLL